MEIATFKPGKLIRKIVNRFLPDLLYARLFMDYDQIDKSSRSEDALLKTLKTGFKVLDELGVKYCLGRGTILGLHRDGKFLPGDIDIDVDVFSDEKVYQIIQKMPFELLLINSSHGRYMQIAFWDSETEVIFDLWFYHKRADRYFNRNYFGYFYLPNEKVNNLTELAFRNIRFPSLEPDWFCEYWYGKDWKKPKKYGKDWTIDYRRDCSAFHYTGRSNIIHL